MFRRKTTEAAAPPDRQGAALGESGESGQPSAAGPFDSGDVLEGTERIDLGGLRVALAAGVELRLQVDEATQSVQAVMLANSDGAVELRAFAAARNGDLWETVRAELLADLKQREISSSEQVGIFGPEVQCALPVALPNGKTGSQPTRFTGINGPRWMLRATFVGEPASRPEQADTWEDLVRAVVVHRGNEAMPPGDPLPLTLPAGARREE